MEGGGEESMGVNSPSFFYFLLLMNLQKSQLATVSWETQLGKPKDWFLDRKGVVNSTSCLPSNASKEGGRFLSDFHEVPWDGV